ncbi:hypothetical protein AMJ49_00155 [Parcubacteria bacterium DG_74_2]|nr:MAG: hypothetical protein AMJ49_00155 [Parcubacteria bacterium DG_74_2]
MTFYQYLIKKQLNSKLTGIILGFLIIGIIFIVSQEFIFFKKEISSLTQIETISIEGVTKRLGEEKTLYTINFGEGNVKSYQIVPSGNSTAFSLLEELAQRENFQLEITLYKEMGVFVESIDGVRNGTDNKYWQYWVNGELPMVAADKKDVKKGDKVEWKFAPSTF